MAQTRVILLDLNFQGRPHTIASYLIKGSEAVVLIESGPGTTLPGLRAGLAANGLSASDVTHVLLTHIHLDHAGAAGWLARQGAQIYVHPLGAPHMTNPEKLLASAARIYGDLMETLWGEFLPVPAEKMTIVEDEQEIELGDLRFVALHTPGHAEHHCAYLFEGVCFSGDIGGVRMPGIPYVRLPMPPPELHFGKWRDSLKRLRKEHFRYMAPTHFGLFDDPAWHLEALRENLEATERWLEGIMAGDPSLEVLRQKFVDWMNEQSRQQGLSAEVMQTYELANPLAMSADGMMRYWKKHRTL